MKIISIVITGLCLISLIFIVWFVRNLYIVPAVDSVAFFESTPQLQQLFLNDVQAARDKKNDINNKTESETNTPQNTMRVVYFWQKNCPCDQLTKPHFLLLMQEYQHLAKAIKFYLAPIDNSAASQDLQTIERLPDDLLDRVRADVKATPSVGIWDGNGQLVYFGPHSLGYVCNNETSFVKKVVDALVNRQNISAAGVMGDGCFCSINASS